MASFGEAFKAARSAGKKTFRWQGKTYHTKTKDEMEKTKKSVPVPTPRPDPQTTSSVATPTNPAPVPVPRKKPSATTMAINATTRASVDAYNAKVREAKERHKMLLTIKK